MNVKKTPTIEKLKIFWSNMWRHQKSYDKKTRLIENLKDTLKKNEPQMFDNIPTEKIKNSLKHTYKWKAPEIDKMNKLLSSLSSTHSLSF